MTEYSFGNPEIIEIDTDILIIGGGMAACGAAFEARRWAPDAKITLVDKAALDRSGAVAMGLSAINTYLGPDRDPADYCRMVSADLMGITRDDLVYDVGRHVDDSVHMFEEWGLPIWKDKSTEGVPLKDGGKPVRSGKWQIMINGEGYKTIVAEAAKKALGIENIIERCFIVKMLLDQNEGNRIAGAVGFSVREHKLYVFRANAILDVAGGAVNCFRPRSTGEGNGRTWYPVWNAGSTYAMAAEVGAELTMMENRFVPARFKDGYGPVGAWFLLFKSKATNGFGEDYVVKNAEMLADFAPYDKATVVPTCLRNHAMLKEMKEGRGPILMQTPAAMAKLAETMTPQEIKHLEAEAWEDFLDMCIGQAGVWAGNNIRPEKTPSELMPTEPYLLGSHSGCCGIWVSGPDDLNSPAEWKWGYNRMTTVKGLFTAGDGVGASGHKFSSGSHAEGRIAAKNMVKFVRDNKGFKPALKGDIKAITEEIYKPVRTYLEHKDKTTAEDVNPNYILPRMLQMRLQKLMDEYVAGVSTYYNTNGKLLEMGLQYLTMLKEDSKKMRAKDLHELMRAWENYHRIVTAEAHLRHIMFREETRYPGFYYRADYPKLNEAEWKCFVNSRIDPDTGDWKCFKRAHVDMVEKRYEGQGH
ncbi:adenylyl-sulfate reductase subunit alpha [Magnetospirillum sp. SS-4]|uniref:adenylyl-sulfate reductase subunit alpha n=1 Tax=Magnetospirillum sp. SS-4 TaxID=2681465 RepID=UPI00137FEA0A|nr:adenylyl-sulfate reductase subunit alpha [Magnetospirillum sp. SS-4]CAA7625167.1 Adenylylsulfate reductase, subunit A [Magnetospirillum sp. SS-4]